MTAPGQSPFDGNPLSTPPIANGYRPTPSDFNGAALTQDPVNPPDQATMPTAPLMNTTSLTLVSIGKAMACAGFGLTAGGSPTFAWWWTAANNVSGNPFSILRNGAGDYSVTWAANLLPVAGWPKARVNALLGAVTSGIVAVNITNGVRI
jgi:hypothetical protein